MAVWDQQWALGTSAECPPRGIPSRDHTKGEKQEALRTQRDGSFNRSRARVATGRKVNVNLNFVVITAITINAIS